MSKHAAYIPKHRQDVSHPALEVPKKAFRASVVMSGLAVAATGVAVSGGLVLTDSDASSTATVSAPITDEHADTQPDTGSGEASTAEPTEPESPEADPAADVLQSREAVVTRSADRREAADPAKAEQLARAAATTSRAITRTEDMADGDPRAIASALLPDYGWSGSQFSCLDSLWTRESNWRVDADNPSSSAYGIPQALPGSKMSTAGADWATNPVTQIKWGLGYIRDRYGSPCGAWAHSESHGWY